MTPDRVWLFEAKFPDPPVAEDLATHDLGSSLQLALGLENYCMAGETENWGPAWPREARELCGPYQEVREALAKLSSEAEPTEETVAASFRLSRETRIGTLEALRVAELRTRRLLAFFFGLGIGVVGVLALGGSGYSVHRLWNRRRSQTEPAQPSR